MENLLKSIVGLGLGWWISSFTNSQMMLMLLVEDHTLGNNWCRPVLLKFNLHKIAWGSLLSWRYGFSRPGVRICILSKLKGDASIYRPHSKSTALDEVLPYESKSCDMAWSFQKIIEPKNDLKVWFWIK